MRYLFFVLFGIVLSGCSVPNSPDQIVSQPRTVATSSVSLASLSATYAISLDLPSNWKAEYVSAVDAVNIYNPDAEATTNLEKSQIFIRNFRASDFLTLSTVNILSRQSDSILGHSAVRYEIEKKSGVAKFVGQPSWRSGRHKLIDVRRSESSPTTFYVISYNPSLGDDRFEEILHSIVFE